MSNSRQSETSYDLRIDFIRFLAFFSVFFTHFINEGGNAIQSATNQWWNNSFIQNLADFGGQGVPIFFALTGFLLGRLLIKEHKITGQISVSAFLLRRILRIWPLYFVFLLLCLLANSFATNTPAINDSEIPFYLSFTYNWGQIFAGIPGSMATITWSVSVEEQIYLMLPILLILTTRPNFKVVAILFMVLGTITLLFADIELIPWGYRQTTSYLLPVGVGIWVANHEDLFRKTALRQKTITLLASIYCVLYPAGFHMIQTTPVPNFASMLCTCVFFVFALHISDRYLNVSFLLTKLLSRIGRVSYGCYLYHWAIWMVMTGREIFYSHTNGFSLIGVCIAFLSTVLISELSYRTFESWFLKKRQKFQRVVSPVI